MKKRYVNERKRVCETRERNEKMCVLYIKKRGAQRRRKERVRIIFRLYSYYGHETEN